ncbi:hypothetical protein ACFOWX_02895 [Sphingorhabdus arenilitoris]|uniref:PAS domain-containing protein n=1 Tax=Sphingorhabdus arenilitoris TaxID=1490041 RepID=A0ABV8RDC6_9SPHN
MDNLRGIDPLGSENNADEAGYVSFDSEETEDAAIEAPPAIGTDERRMQVRAYNFWTSQLHDKNYPSIEELQPEMVEDFRDYSVLLDFTSGIENPSIEYLGKTLRTECGLGEEVSYLDEVPSRSLLSRITDHYLQIIANRAPIGFEAEFVNDRGLTIMYRGILLPYSSDDDTIDFIYGVINWKEAAPRGESAALEQEISSALHNIAPRKEHVPVWADGPAGDNFDLPPLELTGSDTFELGAEFAEAAEPDEDSSLADWLYAARSIADTAKDEDARSRETLYKAIGRAYDFSLIAEKSPEDYHELLADSGVKVQERAPMTPVAKLVFGTNYDKTRLTEFATALNYAHRNAVPMGGLSDLISKHEGGLKGIVKAERQARKVAKGEHVKQVSDPRDKLRSARPRDITEFAGEGDEFIILVARRETDGSVAIVAQVDGDKGLTERVLGKAALD